MAVPVKSCRESRKPRKLPVIRVLYPYPREGTISLFPLVTFNHGKVRTMPGEGPAIVKCPDDPDIPLPDKLKQKGDVYIAVMEIVQMENMNLLFFYLSKKRKS